MWCMYDSGIIYVCSCRWGSLSGFVLSLMGITEGRYRYTKDLIVLESQQANGLSQLSLPHAPNPVVASLLPAIRLHPDLRFAEYILNKLLAGFCIGFSRHCPLQALHCNHPSASQHLEVVRKHIRSELERGSLVEPLHPSLAACVHTSPIGLVPKSQSDKWWMIVDLSAPGGASVNDGISADVCSLTYASVDNAVSIIQYLGQRSQLVKMDLKDAYRIIPVNPQNYHLLSIQWDNQVFVDCSLPFGLRSAPKVFTAFADLVAWIIHCWGVRWLLHYLDDFLLFGAPGTLEVASAAALAMEALANAGIPVAAHKTEGPSTAVTSLGIMVDTVLFQLRLPPEKLPGSRQWWRSGAGGVHVHSRSLSHL